MRPSLARLLPTRHSSSVCFSSVNRFTTSHTGAHGEQIKFTTTSTHETQPLLIPPLDPPNTTSRPNMASSTPSLLNLNTTGSHNKASQIESCTSHYGPAHLNSTFMDTSSTWDIPGQTFDIWSYTSIHENLFGLGQKKDRVQLRNWLCEASNTNITFAERLEKMKWGKKDTRNYKRLEISLIFLRLNYLP